MVEVARADAGGLRLRIGWAGVLWACLPSGDQAGQDRGGQADGDEAGALCSFVWGTHANAERMMAAGAKTRAGGPFCAVSFFGRVD